MKPPPSLSGFAIDPALPSAIPRRGPGSVVTVGTFDGVHIGHREVLREIVARAARTGRRSVLATFHPHPLRIVRPDDAPPLLTTQREKKEILAESGLHFAVFVPFNRTLQNYPARRFVEEILIGRLRMEELVIGYDHGFGRGREGDVDTLRQLGRELGFSTDVVGAVTPASAGEPISSTRIRRAVSAGDMELAAQQLGRPYSLRGIVVRGAQRGRTLGFPTANLALSDSDKLLPAEGIYAVRGRWNGNCHPGVLHLGPLPTFGGSERTIELFLIDFSGDLYGREVQVDFCTRLREVRGYSSAERLVEQMHADVAAARSALAGGKAGGACD